MDKILYLSLAFLLATFNFQQCRGTPTQKVSLARRDLLSDLLNGLGENIQDAVNQGILQNWWQDIPNTVKEIGDKLKISNLDQFGGETEFLNIPGYANYTNSGWNARVRGQMYTLPYFKLQSSTQDELAQAFLPGNDWDRIPDYQKNNARNLTGYIFSVPKEGEDVNLHFKVAPQTPGGINSGQVWEQTIRFPSKTNSAGEIAGFLPLQDPNRQLPSGNVKGGVVGVLDSWTKGIESGNSTTYLVPQEGISILSDIDDILRVTKIYIPKEGLYNTFARNFMPWLNMPSVFAKWSTRTSSSPNGTAAPSPYHFHYLTTTPLQATRTYMDFIYNHYPLGSFDTRPLNFTTVSQTMNSRRLLLYQIFQTFPKRKFVLIGDVSNSDVLSEYPKLVQTFPGQVQCILIRNISKTDPDFHLPYNTAEFEALKSGQYMFFSTPDDLSGLDFANGDCVNQSVPGITNFGWQNLPDGVDQPGDLSNFAATLGASKFTVPAMVLALVAGLMSAL